MFGIKKLGLTSFIAKISMKNIPSINLFEKNLGFVIVRFWNFIRLLLVLRVRGFWRSSLCKRCKGREYWLWYWNWITMKNKLNTN